MMCKWQLSTADGRHYVPSRRNQLIDEIVKRRKKRIITVKEAEALYLDDRPIEQVYQFCYLGAELAADGDEKPEIIKRMNKAMRAFNVIKSVLTDRTLTAKLRLSLLYAYVGSVLLYASETWFDFKFAISQRLNVFSGRIQTLMGLDPIRFPVNFYIAIRGGNSAGSGMPYVASTSERLSNWRPTHTGVKCRWIGPQIWHRTALSGGSSSQRQLKNLNRSV